MSTQSLRTTKGGKDFTVTARTHTEDEETFVTQVLAAMTEGLEANGFTVETAHEFTTRFRSNT